MALDVTVAGTSSDSYCTVAEANTFVGWKNSTAWDAADDTTKEGVLKAAVAVIDEQAYKDPKSDTDQALRFPTSAMYENSAYYIPDRIKRAQAYLALHLLEDPDMFGGAVGIKSVSVAGGYSVTYSEGTSGVGLPADVLQLLSRYLWKYGPTMRTWDSARRSWT